MYKIVNEKPHFVPYDICRVIGTNFMVIIKEVNLNTSQDKDEHQWSYSVNLIEPKELNSDGMPQKIAWYKASELVKVNNVFEIIAKASAHPFSSGGYKFTLEDKRR